MLGVGRRTIVKLFEDAGKTQDDITNLLLVKYNVEMLDKIITADDKIDRLFINFCNPWPRAKHKKRRLTYYKKLEMYKTFLKPDSEIRFKTDEASSNAVLNCNNKMNHLKDLYDMAFDTGCMHEFVMTLEKLKKEKDVSAMDVAKALLDNGIHPPTMYFPLIVHEALMVEPTETEPREVLDHAIEVFRSIY